MISIDNDLLTNYDKIIGYCFDIFQKKQSDYGPTWLINRRSSLIDEIWRKAKRIRSLEEQDDKAYIPEGRDVEYVGIINYCIMYLIRQDKENNIPDDDDILENLSILENIKDETLFMAYKKVSDEIRDLLYKKNSDYGDAWKSMSLYSMTDQAIIRVYRIKTIMGNGGKSLISEGVSSQLQDIVNYCVFALIKMESKLF